MPDFETSLSIIDISGLFVYARRKYIHGNISYPKRREGKQDIPPLKKKFTAKSKKAKK
jgi:hypothetical protein